MFEIVRLLSEMCGAVEQRPDLRVSWNALNEDGETLIMVALKNKEKEMVKVPLKNPGVDRGDIMKTKQKYCRRLTRGTGNSPAKFQTVRLVFPAL